MANFILLTLTSGEAFYVNPEHIAAIFDTRTSGSYNKAPGVNATIVLANELHYDVAGTASEVINYITTKSKENKS